MPNVIDNLDPKPIFEAVEQNGQRPDQDRTTYQHQMITMKEARRRLCVGKTKMQELVKRDQVMSIKIGTKRVIDEASVDALIKRWWHEQRKRQGRRD